MRRSHRAPWQRLLAAAVLVQFASAFGFSMVFPLLPLYVQALGSRWGLSVEVLAGLVFSGQAFTMLIASPVWGALADRWGRRLMVLRATGAGAVVMSLMALARSAEDVVALRVIQGLVTGTIAANNALVAASVPRDRVGYALGWLQVGLWTGTTLGPLVGGYLADRWGFRAAFGATGGLLLVAFLLALLGIEEDRGGHQGTAAKTQGSIWREWLHLLTTPRVVLIYALRFLVRLGQAMTGPFVPLLVQALSVGDLGVATASGSVFGVRSALGALSASVAGWLADRAGYRRVLQGALLCLGFAFLAHALVPDVWTLMLLQAVVGLLIGGVTPVMAALLARSVSPGEEGAAYGLDNSVVAAARTVAPMVGAGLAAAYGYRAPFIVAGALYLGASALLLVSLHGRARLK